LIALLMADIPKPAIILVVEVAARIVVILNYQLIDGCIDQNPNLSCHF